MGRHKHSGAYNGDRGRLFFEFLHQASPQIDVTTVLLFGQFMKARNLLIQAAEKNLAASGLSAAGFRLLMNLSWRESCDRSAGVLPSELSNMQGISRNTVSAMINSLEADGLITREMHSSDHRKFVIRMTPAGRQLVKSTLPKHLEGLAHCFESLNHHERRELHEMLARLTGELENAADGEGKHAKVTREI